MKNIILQHWTGNMNDLGERSSANISKYAALLNADYRLLRGNVFRENLGAPCQKVYMLDKEFDEYDIVVMVDMDMFTRTNMTENVFTDVEGIGRHTTIQDKLVRALHRRFPHLGNPKYPYWGGSIYRLDRKTRQQLRKHIKDDEIINFSDTKNYVDEGIMHRLAVLAKLEITKKTYLPGNHWNCGSFEKGVETAALIHIRTKVTPQGPKRAKLENYRDLVQQGLIEK